MKVLMLGWEFPPFKTGGLGTACYGLTKGLEHMGVAVTFVAPVSCGIETPDHVRFIGTASTRANPEKTQAPTPTHVPSVENTRISSERMDDYTHVRLVEVDVPLAPYARPGQRREVHRISYTVGRELATQSKSSDVKQHSEVQQIQKPEQHELYESDEPSCEITGDEDLYGWDLFERIDEYTSRINDIAEREEFDIIHAHDWMTFSAGIAARKVSGKPLLVHLHSTEYDRTGGQGCNPIVYDIERATVREADGIITVSNRTKRRITSDYGVPARKIDVVYNAIDVHESAVNVSRQRWLKKKMVLFLGRMTVQKGPDYFLEAAARVLEKEPDTIFVMAGSGDMTHRMIERASDLRICHKVLFPGFLRGSAVDRMYKMADVFVMSSVSEPFGLTPLEAMSYGVPVVISRQSGVSEVIRNALKVNFWDIDGLASRITALLRYRPLRDLLGSNGKSEISSFSWDNAAAQCMDVYNKILGKALPEEKSSPSQLESRIYEKILV